MFHMFCSSIIAFRQQLQPTKTSPTTKRKYLSYINKLVEIPPYYNTNQFQPLTAFYFILFSK